LDSLNKILGWPLFTIGGTQTVFGSLLAAILIVVATLLIAKLARKSVQRLARRSHVEDANDGRTCGIVVQVIIWLIGIEIALHILGIRLTTLFATTGFFAIAAGFAAKNIVENLMSGAILRFERIIKPEDVVIVGGKSVVVKRVGMRITKARTYDGVDVLIPNSMIAQSMVQNLTRDDRLFRIQIRVGVSFTSDLILVRQTLEKTVNNLEWRSRTQSPTVYLSEFGDSSINYEIFVWIDDLKDSFKRKSDLYEAVWRALTDADITIAYPQLDLHLDQNLVDAMASQK
jgi:small-conductance mechanosensitive channel